MTQRWRGWALYALAWVPVYLLYLQVLVRMAGRPLGESMWTSLEYALSAGLLGVLVWYAAGTFPWPSRNAIPFILLQGVFALLYSTAWFLSIVLYIGWDMPLSMAWDISQRFIGWQLLSGLWVYGVIAGVSYALRTMQLLRERDAATARAETARMRAELQALRGQLNPHFLFNTLHTVQALVGQDPRTAERTLERFAGLLRYVLDAKRLERDDVTLADELSFVRDYLALEQVRLGDRLIVREDIDPEALEIAIPSLSLQPLVENAIVHAVAPRAGGATVTIRATLEGDELVVVIADDGPGGVSDDIARAHGLGLRVGRQRLETRYAGKARFSVATAPGKGFAVTLALPAHVATAEHSAVMV